MNDANMITEGSYYVKNTDEQDGGGCHHSLVE